jgi:cell division protein FtsX
MSDKIHSPVEPELAEPKPALGERFARHERWIVPVAAAAVALAVGASGTVAGLLITGWRPRVDRVYSVTVFLKTEVTPPQQAAVQAALGKMTTVDGIHLETRDEAFANVQKWFAANPGRTLGVKADDMPEAFKASTKGPNFDCTVMSAVQKMPGVQDTVVTTVPVQDLPGATIFCL